MTLRELRTQKNLTQGELAHLCYGFGVRLAASDISNMESGRRYIPPPPSRVRAALAEVLGVRPEEIT